jgi:hypothetical protein
LTQDGADAALAQETSQHQIPDSIRKNAFQQHRFKSFGNDFLTNVATLSEESIQGN